MPSPPETWRPVVGYEQSYEVSDQGRVRSIPRSVLRSDGKVQPFPGLVLSPSINQGYRKVSLCGKVRKVCVLVLEAFVGQRPAGMEACHKNGISTDDGLDNLRWGTRKSNVLDMITHGRAWWMGITHCSQGHPFNETNTYIPPGGQQRMCRTCRHQRVTAARAAKRAA